jgi:UDP-N-acetylglucosamine 2-epimerase
MAPVVRCLRRDPLRFSVRVLFTGQHRELLHQTAEKLQLRCDADLALMQENQGLSTLFARVLEGVDADLVQHPAEVVIAQGDTTSVAAAALACHHRRVAFGHVEAGLRTNDRLSPFPEEGNRRMVATLTDLHFAPTREARDALLRENVDERRVWVTGNTVIDVLHETLREPLPMPIALGSGRLLALLTMHRRESFDGGLERVFEAIRRLVQIHPDLDVVYPVHPNPAVRALASRLLSDLHQVCLTDPMDHRDFVALMSKAALILTDSGGVQEEAPSLGVPILVLRDTTERPEGVAAGCARLVGTDTARIVATANHILAMRRAGATAPAPENPYGDGRASQRIADAVWAFCRPAQRVSERRSA